MHAAEATIYDLVVVIDEFAVGGVASLYSTIVEATTAHGLTVAVVGRAGPSKDQLDWGAADTIEVPLWDEAASGTLRDLVGRAERVVWQACPPTLPLFLSLLPHPRTSLVFHGSAGLTRAWFGDERIAVLVAALASRPTLSVMAPSSTMVGQLSELLGLAPGRCRVLPHVSAARASTHRPTSRPRPRVVVPTRVSPEKRFVITAAYDLATSRNLPLTVVGVGSDGDWVRGLGELSDVEVELVDDADIHRHVGTDDVVVAVGLVALECARYCGAVVSASLHEGGCLDRVLTPDTVDTLYEDNFLGTDAGPLPDAVWQSVDRLSDADRQHVRRRLDALADPSRASTEMVAAGESDDGTLDQSRLLDVVASAGAAWAAQTGADTRWIGELVEGRDWLTQHTTELTAWVVELERAATYHRERAEAFEQRLAAGEQER